MLTLFQTKKSKLPAAAHSLSAFSLVLLTISSLTHCKSDKNFPVQPELSALTELKKFSFSQPHLGTTVQLVFYTHDDEIANQLAQQCFQRVRDLNAIFSDYAHDSELSQLCNKPINKAHLVSDPLFKVIAQAQEISAKSNGAFDITVGNYTKRWRNRSLVSPAEIKPQDPINYRFIQLDPKQKTITLLNPVSLDLGGIAKGYIADELMLVLKQAGIHHSAVIVGGETVLAAAPPDKDGWCIGIEDPEHKIIGTLSLENTCLSTSGDSYQFFVQDKQRLSHLIDPATKTSKTNRLNVITIAPSAMLADGWATALRILPIEKSLPLAKLQPDLQAALIPFKEKILTTDRFPAIQPSQP